ncbi:AAA family ATPase [Rhizobium leguminosarum]|uniref:AAA family ATPase n=1 Tax=Rhizobium leguminosarum TaxID=384 RepID=UPI001C906994|nr:AAA family ATPase [Rhizobium leguminosarum]MBY3175642.1 AAA family ATPase [Rhizobium leguminosarum]
MQQESTAPALRRHLPMKLRRPSWPNLEANEPMTQTSTQLDTNLEDLRAMSPTPATDSREALIFGICDRLLDNENCFADVVLIPADENGEPDYDRADPANVSSLPADEWPQDPQAEKRAAVIVSDISGCHEDSSFLVATIQNDQPQIIQIHGPEADLDIGLAIIARDIGAVPNVRPPSKLAQSLDKLREELFAPKAPPVAANDNKPAKAPPETAGIRLLSFSEFKAQENSTADALIKGLVRTGTLIAIGGRPGAGKTALTLAMAGALDAGEPFLGRETKPTTIVVIAAEDGGDVANRLEAMGNDRIKIAKLPEGLPLTKPPKAAAVAREVIRQAKAIDPTRHVMIVVDTLRAALGGVSVLEDKTTSPALNALREVAESEGAVVAILNHTNRENNKATKGETLEAVAALEIVLLEGEGDWFTIYVGKNRSGPGHRNIGKVKYTSAEVGGVSAAVVDELVADETITDGPKERGPSGNAKILHGIIQTAILESSETRKPFGIEGPQVKVVSVEAIRTSFYERKEGSTDTKLKAFNRAIAHWIEKQWVVRGEGQDGGLLWFARVRDEKAGQPDGHSPNQAYVRPVRLEEDGRTGQVDRDCPVLSGSEAS